MKGFFAQFPHAVGSALALKYPTDKDTVQVREATPGPAGPSYRWCSARRSSRGCIHTCHRGRSHALHSAGGRPAGRRPPPSSLPRSGRCPPHTRRGPRSQQHRFLWGGREGCQERQEREEKERKKSTEQVVAGNKSHTWLPSLASGSSWDSRGWGS